MRFCDFFAGIGGFKLGLERAGHKGVWACEVDSFCRKIYAQHFEEPRGKDINDVEPNEIPEADLWCGGFPCQDLSVGGRGGGLQANRSGLYWVWYNLIRKRKPQWLLIENVPGLLTAPRENPGADFALLLSSLDEIGYGLVWRVLDAQFFGLAQHRDRVFIVGRFGKPCPSEVLFERESMQGHSPQKQRAGHQIAHGLTTGLDRWKPDQDTYVIAKSYEWWKQNGGATESIVAAPPNPIGARTHSGLPGWLDTPDTPRCKALGNAVAVPVVEWIGRRLKAYG